MTFRNRMICDIKCLQHQQLEDIVFQRDFLVLQRGSPQRMKTTRGNGARVCLSVYSLRKFFESNYEGEGVK